MDTSSTAESPLKRVRSHVVHAAMLVVLFGAAVVAAGALPFGLLDAGAVSGTVGPITVTATPNSQVGDGQAIAIHADAADGTVIYELKAHLCLPNANIRSNFDFGFQGKKCSNAPVGAGDVEQTASFGEGVTSADLDTFKVGQGSVHWVNELGYDQTLDCGPGKQCDVVVRVQITGGTAFYTVPLCYGPQCTPEGGPPPTDPPTTAPPAPAAAASAGTASDASGGAGGSANPSAVAGAASAPKSAAAAAAAKRAQSGTNSEEASAHPVNASAESSVGLTNGWRVVAAAVAGAVAAADIARVVTRTRRRTRRFTTA